jgi:SAM-dependent methyltransferase
MAVVIGVLEWVPSSYPKDDPEDLQFETLKEIRRVLKENGKLLLAIENRYYLGYWLGRIDHHTGLRFVPLLPRKLASFISRITRGEPYLNWTHSYWKLNEILQRAGFKVLKIFVGIPSYTLPDEIADVSNEKEVLNKLDSAKLQKLNAIVWKMLNAMKLMKLFVAILFSFVQSYSYTLKNEK